jgi:hypothetical protein
MNRLQVNESQSRAPTEIETGPGNDRFASSTDLVLKNQWSHKLPESVPSLEVAVRFAESFKSH